MNTSGTTGEYIRIAPSSSTLPSSTEHILAAPSIAVPATVVVAEAKSILREVRTKYLYSSTLHEIDDDYSDDEEMEWDTLFAQPHVQARLDRLEEEAMRQIAAGEIEEGGFAVE